MYTILVWAGRKLLGNRINRLDTQLMFPPIKTLDFLTVLRVSFRMHYICLIASVNRANHRHTVQRMLRRATKAPTISVNLDVHHEFIKNEDEGADKMETVTQTNKTKKMLNKHLHVNAVYRRVLTLVSAVSLHTTSLMMAAPI